MMPHSALTPGSVAVVTGGAAGIGLAAAMQTRISAFASAWHPDYADAFEAFSRKRR